jgi:hypothetical protein
MSGTASLHRDKYQVSARSIARAMPPTLHDNSSTMDRDEFAALVSQRA